MKNLLKISLLATLLIVTANPAHAVTEIWRRAFGTTTIGLDEGRCVTMDAAGNVYSAGFCSTFFSEGHPPQREAFIAKYSPEGATLWSFSYNPFGDYSGNFLPGAEAVAISVNAAGEVITAIQSTGFDGQSDAVVLKLDAKGDLIWERRLNQAGARVTNLVDAVFGADGAVHVVGSNPDDPDGSPAIARINADGSVAWVTTLPSSNGVVFENMVIGVDAPGAVYFCSTRQSSGVEPSGSSEFFIQRLHPNGTLDWLRTADGILSDIAVSSTGNVTVCGRTNVGSASEEMNVRQYNAAGVLEWNETLSSPDVVPKKVRLDADGNALIAGTVFHGAAASSDIIAIKYSPIGIRLWTAVYDSGPGSSGRAVSLVLDGAGNAVVAGLVGATGADSMEVINFDATDGHERWAALPGGSFPSAGPSSNFIAVDGSGNVALSGLSVAESNPRRNDMLTTLLDNTGAKRWDVAESADGVLDSPDKMVISNDGTTWVYGSGDLVRYDQNGAERLVNLEGLISQFDSILALADDGAGGIYILSTVLQTVGGVKLDINLVHVPADGVAPTRFVFALPGKMINAPRAMAVDDSGHVLVAGIARPGYFFPITTTTDAFVAKVDLSGAGAIIWSTTYDSPTSMDESAIGIGLDSAGNVYVGGDEIGTNGVRDYFTLKLDANGTRQWVARYDGPGPASSDDKAAAFVVSSDGTSTLTGTTYRTVGPRNASTVRWNSDGQLQWAAQRDLATATDRAYTLVVDGSGNCSIGTAQEKSETGVYATKQRIIRLSASGLFQWESDFGKAEDPFAFSPPKLAGGSQGELYLLTQVTLPDRKNSLLAARMNTSGAVEWELRLPDSKGASSTPNTIAQAPDGSLRIIASSSGGFAARDRNDWITIRLDQIGGAPSVATRSVSAERWLAIVNPNEQETSVAFEFGVGAFSSTTAPMIVSGASDHIVQFTPSGLPPHTAYFVRAVATNSSGTARGETLSFTTPNQSPQTHPDEAQSDGSAVEILPLANDADPDGDSLQLFAITGEFSDGSITRAGNKLTFSPSANFEGTAQIAYQASDGFSARVNGTITVHVHRAPTIVSAFASKRGTGSEVQTPLGTGTLHSFGQPTLLGAEAGYRATILRGGLKSDGIFTVGSSRVDLQACKLEYSIVSPK